MKPIKTCVVCGREIRKKNNDITCSRECLRKYRRIYNLIYGRLSDRLA